MKKRSLRLPVEQAGKIVPYPLGWDWVWMPFRPRRGGNLYGTFHTGGFNLRSHANISVAKTYYVKMASEGGNDGNSGADEANALATVAAALEKADVDRILIKAGEYNLTSGWNYVSPNRNLEVIGYGGAVYLTAYAEGLVWGAVGSHYEAACATTVLNVYDKTNLDANGDFTKLTKKTSIAEVDAAANSWYYNAGTLYVRTFDDRAPDADILPFTQSNNGSLNDAVTYYLEGLQFWGGVSAFSLSSASASCKLYAKNCVFAFNVHGSGNGLGVAGGGLVILENCVAKKNGYDGFKLYENTGQYANGILINCTGRSNGELSSVGNGCSRHDRGNTVIINGEFYENAGPNIHDIDYGAGDPQVWILGAYSHDSASENFHIGTAANEGGEMWLDTCKSENPGSTDLEAETNASLKYHNLDPASPSTAGAGTIATY